jgi:hypothetical protein
MCGKGDSNSQALFKALPPQGSASTNFAIAAFMCKVKLYETKVP